MARIDFPPRNNKDKKQPIKSFDELGAALGIKHDDEGVPGGAGANEPNPQEVRPLNAKQREYLKGLRFNDDGIESIRTDPDAIVMLKSEQLTQLDSLADANQSSGRRRRGRGKGGSNEGGLQDVSTPETSPGEALDAVAEENNVQAIDNRWRNNRQGIPPNAIPEELPFLNSINNTYELLDAYKANPNPDTAEEYLRAFVKLHLLEETVTAGVERYRAEEQARQAEEARQRTAAPLDGAINPDPIDSADSLKERKAALRRAVEGAHGQSLNAKEEYFNAVRETQKKRSIVGIAAEQFTGAHGAFRSAKEKELRDAWFRSRVENARMQKQVTQERLATRPQTADEVRARLNAIRDKHADNAAFPAQWIDKEGGIQTELRHQGKGSIDAARLQARYERLVTARTVVRGAEEEEHAAKMEGLSSREQGALEKLYARYQKLPPGVRIMGTSALLVGVASIGGAIAAGGITGASLIPLAMGSASAGLRWWAEAQKNPAAKKSIGILSRLTSVMGVIGLGAEKAVELGHAQLGTAQKAEATLSQTEGLGDLSDPKNLKRISKQRMKAHLVDERIKRQGMWARTAASMAGFFFGHHVGGGHAHAAPHTETGVSADDMNALAHNKADFAGRLHDLTPTEMKAYMAAHSGRVVETHIEPMQFRDLSKLDTSTPNIAVDNTHLPTGHIEGVGGPATPDTAHGTITGAGHSLEIGGKINDADKLIGHFTQQLARQYPEGASVPPSVAKLFELLHAHAGENHLGDLTEDHAALKLGFQYVDGNGHLVSPHVHPGDTFGLNDRGEIIFKEAGTGEVHTLISADGHTVTPLEHGAHAAGTEHSAHPNAQPAEHEVKAPAHPAEGPTSTAPHGIEIEDASHLSHAAHLSGHLDTTVPNVHIDQSGDMSGTGSTPDTAPASVPVPAPSAHPTPEAPPAASTAPHVPEAAAPEVPAPAPELEHAVAHLMDGTPVNPDVPDTYTDAQGHVFAYGGTYDQQHQAAIAYALRHPGVGVQYEGRPIASGGMIHNWTAMVMADKEGHVMDPEYPTNPIALDKVPDPEKFIRLAHS